MNVFRYIQNAQKREAQARKERAAAAAAASESNGSLTEMSPIVPAGARAGGGGGGGGGGRGGGDEEDPGYVFLAQGCLSIRGCHLVCSPLAPCTPCVKVQTARPQLSPAPSCGVPVRVHAG